MAVATASNPLALSKRARELFTTLIDAFYDGDRWVRFTSPHTARMTGESLVRRGVAEWDVDDPRYAETDGFYSMRIRVSEEWLRDNGMTRGIRFFAGVTLNELNDISDAVDAARATVAATNEAVAQAA